MSKIRRICFCSGPCGGKSTTAAYVFSQLKHHCNTNIIDLKIELVQEFVKSWAWGGRKIDGWDQWTILANQLEREYHLLRHGVDLLVTDSALAMYPYYAERSNCPAKECVAPIVQAFEAEFPSLHIFLSRDDKTYFQHGRYETLEQAKAADDGIREVLKQLSIPYVEFPFRDTKNIWDFVLDKTVSNRFVS